MKKYLSIDTLNEGTMLIPVSEGAIALLADDSTVFIGTTSGAFVLSCSNANQALIDSINAALVVAAESPSTKAVSKVGIPNKVKVNEIFIEGLGPEPPAVQLSEYAITISIDAPYPIEFDYIDGFGQPKHITVPNDGKTSTYVGERDTMKIDQVATPVDPILVTIEETPL